MLTRKRLVIAALALILLAGVAAVFAVIHDRGDKKAAPTTAAPEASTNLYYLKATRPQTGVRGCTMTIRFHWVPDYHAEQYIPSKALIQLSGPGIAGTFPRPFTEKGVSIDAGIVSLAGGYKLWSAKVLSLDGDPPGNDTTVQTAPPRSTKCR